MYMCVYIHFTLAKLQSDAIFLIRNFQLPGRQTAGVMLFFFFFPLRRAITKLPIRRTDANATNIFILWLFSFPHKTQ